MRRNRFDPANPDHVLVHEDPAKYTRASRRAAGHRGSVHNALPAHWTRSARRAALALVNASATRRNRKRAARLRRDIFRLMGGV